ncbi:NACHT C-terminal alpha/beta 1 domain-containing protein [Microcoleus sp. BROC3]|uniref:NACHT C-terminal alpha/beta 1 domain-containing protein n=1 Tax=Microcoleus sp. BROC3 TaxID=3055323 RepID=UPI002FD1320F
MGIKFELDDIHVPLGLVERPQKVQRRDDSSPEEGSRVYREEKEKITPIDYDDFFQQVLANQQSPKSNGKRLNIIGEPGAGKTTQLLKIADWVLHKTEGLPIWISLGVVGEKPLQEYLLKDWLPDAAGKLDAAPPQWVEQLEQHLKDGRVWLLLDGADEMQVADPLGKLAEFVRVPLLKNVRVVLTCRLNLWDAAANALSEFDTYKMLDFSYGDGKNSDQVKQFIDKWFENPSLQEAYPCVGGTEAGQQLREALDQTGKERIKDLARNPLRLALLCFTWQSGRGKLPDTKAELYEVLVAALYTLKKGVFPTESAQQIGLNAALGRLALKAIDKGFKSILPHSLVYEELKKPHPELFELADKLGWLNQVGVEPENRRQPVYAFFHPTFQEYFAACEIPDWDFFLPRNHKDRPVKYKDNSAKYKKYRIFETQWKEVILLWLGRKNLPNQEKERFIKKLMEFEDGCGLHSFYGALCYFIAAAGTSEFLECPETMAIMDELIKFAFGEFDFETWEQTSYLEPIALGSIEALQNMPHDKLVEKLIPIMDLNSCNNLPVKPAHLLWQSDCTNTELIITLIKLLGEKNKDLLPSYHWLFGNFLNNRDTKKIIAKVPDILHLLIESLIKKTFNGERSLRTSVINAFRNPWLKSFLPTSSTLIPSVLEDFLSGNLDTYLRLPVLAERITRNPDILDSLLYLLEYWDDIVVMVCNLSKPPSIERKNITLNKRLKGQDKNDFYQTSEYKSEYKEEFSKIENIDYIEIADDNDIIEIEVMEMASQLISILQNTKYGVENKIWLRHDTDMLMDILKNDDYYDSFPENAVINTTKYDRKVLDTWVIKGLKYCLSEKVYNEDFIRFKYCYEIVWYCAQNMSYPDFYQAWHCEPSTSHPEVDNIPVGNSPEAQILEAQNLDFNKLQPTQHSYLLAINLLSLKEETEQGAIAQKICTKIYKHHAVQIPGKPPTVKNDAELQQHLFEIQDKLQRPNLALVLYVKDTKGFHEPTEEAIAFCQQLADPDLGIHLAWITNQSLEQPLKDIQPDPLKLISKIQSWIDEIV